MTTKRRRSITSTSIAFALALALGLTSLPANATGCDASSCWAADVKFLRIDEGGRIWFVVDGAAALSNLVPADGCVLRSIWSGTQTEPALYIPPGDQRADGLYTMLLTAFVTGSQLSFAPIKDTATGWCALNAVSMKP